MHLLFAGQRAGDQDRSSPSSKTVWLERSSGDLVGGRVRDLEGLHSGSTFNHSRQGLQDLRIRLSVVGIRAVFLIPETDGYGLITFCGDEADLFVKSLLFAEQRNDLPIKNIGKLGRAKRIGLKLQRDVARINFHLLVGWIG